MIMNQHDEIEFVRARWRQEQELAAASRDVAVKAIHQQMAGSYKRQIAEYEATGKMARPARLD
jgi:hypothetical protein